MRNLSMVIITELLLVAIALTVAVTMPPYFYLTITGLIIVMILVGLLYRRFSLPLQKIETGMDLLTAQDFSSSLKRTGQKDADKIICIFNEMISQLRNEVLRNQEHDHFLKQLIDASPMGIITLDLNRRVDLINNAALKFLKTNLDLKNKKFSLLDIKSELAAHLKSLKPDESSVVYTSGAERFRCSCLTFMDRGFRRHFYLIERLTDEMRHAEREAYGKVIRTIAHEVNNSMAATKSILDITETVVADDPDFLAAISSCKSRIDSMTEFITKYASVVKTLPVNLKQCDFNELITRNLAFYEAMCVGTDVKISCHLNPTPVEVRIDRILIEQVLVNIIKNAVESCGDRGEVEICTLSDKVIIADNGKGITAEHARNLFDPFFTTKPNGHGIGLMFAAETLRRHNFEFTLATDPVDKKTRFTIIL
ncbi:MAG: ATP-binding protein [Muribaculum sp.]|nr:ATP-binding protein [Muribaculaceae bacterium]MCM1080677.1 ATP-binding protein [Muribaculum sp.]